MLTYLEQNGAQYTVSNFVESSTGTLTYINGLWTKAPSQEISDEALGRTTSNMSLSSSRSFINAFKNQNVQIPGEKMCTTNNGDAKDSTVDNKMTANASVQRYKQRLNDTQIGGGEVPPVDSPTTAVVLAQKYFSIKLIGGVYNEIIK